MPTVSRPSGVRVTLPEALSLPVEAPDADSATRRARRSFPASTPIVSEPMPGEPVANDEAAQVARALAAQDLTLVDTVALPAVPPALRRAAPPEVEIDLPLAADEDAVVLLEQDGVYAWQFEAERTATPLDSSTRRHRGAAAEGRNARFRIRLAAAEGLPADEGDSRMRRGWLSDALKGVARAMVFKFTGRFLLGRATAFLERHVQPGVMLLLGNDPTAWPLIGDFRSVDLPAERPGRILLFIHGTFSSTQGGFGALCATPWGVSFLEAARANYDAVIGFDHPTLSVDPRVNATELLRAMEARSWQQPVEIDIVCHSRGAITVRSLTEHLLPATRLPVKIGRIVFAGGVNAGTLLAAPENWRTLIDLYTNLAVGTTRAMALFPMATFASGLLPGLLQGIGALAKSLVQSAVGDGAIPGLAAMNPSGPFITEINRTQPGQPAAPASAYYAITSNFSAKRATSETSGLSGRFIRLLADGFMDRLMRTDNDLVVHLASMTAIDPQSGNFFKDALAFGENGVVYHTNYFLQPRAVQAMAHWLELPLAAAAEPTRRRRALPAGAMITPPASATVDENVLVLSASELAADAADVVRDHAPRYAVIEHSKENVFHRYAFKADEVAAAARAHPGATLEQALRLSESDASPHGKPGAMPPPKPADSGPPASRRTVVLEGGSVVGVAEPTIAPESLEELLKKAQETDAQLTKRVSFRERDNVESTANSPARPVVFTSVHGDMHVRKNRDPFHGFDAPLPSSPAFSPAADNMPLPPTPAPSSATETTCHFLAEMDDEVVLHEVTSIDVTLSRETIVATRGASAGSAAIVSTADKLVLDLITKRNFAPAGKTRLEVDVPVAGKPTTVVFDVEPTDPGEGEVWVRVRQNGVQLTTLVLRPQIVAARARPPGRAAVSGRVEDAGGAMGPQHELTIFENERGGKRVYQFLFDSPALGWKLNYESKPLEGSRETYVAHLYEDIENRWLTSNADFDQFELELREFGAGLWEELVPEELRKVLWQEKDNIQSILVYSEEPFIPWELLFLTEPGQPIAPTGRFLGEMGLVRWQYNLRTPPTTLRARPGRCWYVIPKYQLPKLRLVEAEKEAQFLIDRFSAGAIPPTLAPVRQKLAGPGAFDLLHFACHGDADSGDISRAELLLEGRVENGSYIYERLRPSVVAYSAKFGGPGAVPPIVVLNACRASRQGYKLTSIGGFAREFLRQGAGLFVGALWSVGDVPARNFTEELYARLLAGDTLAAAAIAARRKARDAGEGTWLAYTVYGHPRATLTTA